MSYLFVFDLWVLKRRSQASSTAQPTIVQLGSWVVAAGFWIFWSCCFRYMEVSTDKYYGVSHFSLFTQCWNISRNIAKAPPSSNCDSLSIPQSPCGATWRPCFWIPALLPGFQARPLYQCWGSALDVHDMSTRCFFSWNIVGLPMSYPCFIHGSSMFCPWLSMDFHSSLLCDWIWSEL